MTYYEVLGVSRQAGAGEIRSAYLHLARRHHPDLAAYESPAARRDAEREMQRINEAWAVLGDELHRLRYDSELRRCEGEPAPKPRRASGMASPDFVPLDDADEDVELLDDTPIPDTSVPRWLQVMGPSLFVVSVALACVGLVTSFRPFFNVAALSFMGSVFSVVAALLVATTQSARSDRP